MATNEELQELAAKAGLGPRSTKKLLAANSDAPTGEKKTRGHGAARPKVVMLDEL